MPPGEVGTCGAIVHRRSEVARQLQQAPVMEITEGTRLEKALVVAACFPFLVIGLLFLFA